ncbi:tRNA pseudouridine(55) synthase TruB [Sediminibacillus dalangtanensis]|uniref:tRNA pseudouridine synthase B n=1 Tax=Sediminibacillus dalangtanensis TaxID=2729421 RepID=A0ABX7VRC3_9BACI|nr:tRNA pseudouridine(55) synthase TruB [Sediminibacillus dalangtanensis]QTM99456.1 tRNA pseudouridine(55) synthase TruB [Sediminibacillus dalangtanensis]
MDGILPLWKPKGWTSHDCVAKIRRLYGTKKVGHTGTLDPEVEGVLPICVGQATKLVPYLTETNKTYIAEVTLGSSTETEDSFGEVVEQAVVQEDFSVEQVQQVLDNFIGYSVQVPPMYSAVKVNGKRLYEYARKGLTVNRPERTIHIERIQLLSDIRKEGQRVRFCFLVECGKGTYVRTLCVNIGDRLGYPAHMSGLVRTKTGSFDRNSTYTIEEVQQAKEKNAHLDLLLPLSAGITDLEKVEADADLADRVFHGQKLKMPEGLTGTKQFRIQQGDKLLAIYQSHPSEPGIAKPAKVFHYEQD